MRQPKKSVKLLIFLHFSPKNCFSQPLKSGEAAASPVPPPLITINVKKTFHDTTMTSLGPHIALLISNVAIGMDTQDTHLVKMTVAAQHVVANQ